MNNLKKCKTCKHFVLPESVCLFHDKPVMRRYLCPDWEIRKPNKKEE